jgi:hypothetical protein
MFLRFDNVDVQLVSHYLLQIGLRRRINRDHTYTILYVCEYTFILFQIVQLYILGGACICGYTLKWINYMLGTVNKVGIALSTTTSDVDP